VGVLADIAVLLKEPRLDLVLTAITEIGRRRDSLGTVQKIQSARSDKQWSDARPFPFLVLVLTATITEIGGRRGRLGTVQQIQSACSDKRWSDARPFPSLSSQPAVICPLTAPIKGL